MGSALVAMGILGAVAILAAFVRDQDAPTLTPAEKASRRGWLYRSVARARVADVREPSRVRLVGTVVAADETLESPVAGRACVHHVLALSGGERDARTCDFLVADASGRARVRVARAQFDLRGEPHARYVDTSKAPPRLLAALARAGVAVKADGEARYFHASEECLAVGERVTVVGWAHWEQDVVTTHYRDAAPPAERRLVIEATATDPLLVGTRAELFD